MLAWDVAELFDEEENFILHLTVSFARVLVKRFKVRQYFFSHFRNRVNCNRIEVLLHIRVDTPVISIFKVLERAYNKSDNVSRVRLASGLPNAIKVVDIQGKCSALRANEHRARECGQQNSFTDASFTVTQDFYTCINCELT